MEIISHNLAVLARLGSLMGCESPKGYKRYPANICPWRGSPRSWLAKICTPGLPFLECPPYPFVLVSSYSTFRLGSEVTSSRKPPQPGPGNFCVPVIPWA